MPQDKNTRARHEFLDECFMRESLPVDALLDKLNNHLVSRSLKPVSERTLRSDIKILESEYGAEFVPGLWDGKKKLYHYADGGFSIRKFNELSDSNKHLLVDAANLLSQVAGLPGDDTFEKVKMDICNIANIDTLDSKVIFYDSVAELKGLKKWWQHCYAAILQRKALRIDYQEFNDPTVSFAASPYALKEFNRRWYLICAHHDDPSRYYNIPLDRIVNIQQADGEAFVPNALDIEEYYEDVFGITNRTGDPVEHVRFVAYGLTAKYIETKPFYPYCHFKWLSDNELEVSLKVKINYELEHQLLSWADSIKILEPSHLVERHLNLLKKALGHYGSLE